MILYLVLNLIWNPPESHTEFSTDCGIWWFSDWFQSHFCVVAESVEKEKITETTGLKQEKQSLWSENLIELQTESLLVDFLLTIMIYLIYF